MPIIAKPGEQPGSMPSMHIEAPLVADYASGDKIQQ